MTDNRDRTTTTAARPMSRLWQSLSILAFGIATLVFLVAIDRPHWFVLKPATGTAAAMFAAGHASTSPPATDASSLRQGNDAG